MEQHDNLEEFRDPVTYDSEYGKLGKEMDFYGNLARKTGGPILDLACGTGKLSIPFAQRGFAVTGVDITPEMLERAQQKAREANVQVEWLLGDCRTVDINRKFRLIFMTGNAFQAFLDRESQDKLLTRVHEHLQEDGLFAFETRAPILSELAQKQGSERVKYEDHFFDERGFEVIESGYSVYDALTQIEYCTTHRRWTDASGAQVSRTTRIDLRYVFPQELEALLYNNGFSLVERYGSFDKAPFTAESQSMVCVCKKRQG